MAHVLEDTTTGSVNGADLSFSATLAEGSADRVILVLISMRGNPGDTSPNSVTIGGTACALAGTDAGGGFEARASIYYMLESDIPSGSSATLSIDTPGSQQVGATVHVFSGSFQGSVTNFESTTTSSSQNNIDTDITTVEDDSILVDVITGDGGGTESPNAGQTEQSNLTQNTLRHATSTELGGITGLKNLGWTWTSSPNRQTHAVVELRESATVVITGTAAVETGPIELAASGNAGVNANAAVDVGPAELAASGAVAVSGTSDLDMGPIELAASGLMSVVGTADVEAGPIELLAIGENVVIVAGDLPAGPSVLDAEVKIRVAGTGALVAGPSELAGVGQVDSALALIPVVWSHKETLELKCTWRPHL